MKPATRFALFLSVTTVLPIGWGETIANAASIKSSMPRSVCACYDGGYQFGRYNYSPSNSGQAETQRFKCNMKGWEQAFRDGWNNGNKDYRFANGDTRQGMGTSLCPY